MPRWGSSSRARPPSRRRRERTGSRSTSTSPISIRRRTAPSTRTTRCCTPSRPTTRRRRSDFMTYLVTGALGALGAWVVRALLDREQEVVTYDLGGSDHRLRLALGEDELAALARVDGDV